MSILDFVNTIMLNDAAIKADNNNLAFKLSDRASELSERFGVTVPNYETFYSQQSQQEPRGFLGRLAHWAVIGGSVGALFGGLAVAGVLQVSSAMILPMGAAIAGFSVLGALVDESKPEHEKKQLERYQAFLLETEKKLEHAVAKGAIKEKASGLTVDEQIAKLSQTTNKSETHFRDLVGNSRDSKTLEGAISV